MIEGIVVFLGLSFVAFLWLLHLAFYYWIGKTVFDFLFKK